MVAKCGLGGELRKSAEEIGTRELIILESNICFFFCVNFLNIVFFF